MILDIAGKNERESASFSVVSRRFTESDTEAMRKDYSSDPAGSQWQKIGTVLNTSRHRQHDLRRDILDALFCLVKRGAERGDILRSGCCPADLRCRNFCNGKRCTTTSASGKSAA